MDVNTIEKFFRENRNIIRKPKTTEMEVLFNLNQALSLLVKGLAGDLNAMAVELSEIKRRLTP